VVLLQDSLDEPFFEFSNGFVVQNAALIHLGYECFELILHGYFSFEYFPC
jgi:hypothetical protein